MEQRAPGHTVLDDKIYSKGMLDFKRDIATAIAALDFENDAEALDKRDALRSMEISSDAVILFAARHADLAQERAAQEKGATRRGELEKIAAVCRHVPAHAPRDFHEALQYYWFCHLAVITELNGWDAFNPGHLDQHLLPFYEQGLADGTLTESHARELLEAFFVKFNNHPAPPKVGVTAAESGTYTDFANINIGGMLRDGSDGSNKLSHVLLDIVDEMHLLQPSSNIQLSRKSPDAFLKHALRVIRKGYGFPSVFNADAVVQEQVRQGKSLEDARAGGCSGCVEVGAFGKEAYILTGYFNLVKLLELALHDGVDPPTGKQIGPSTGKVSSFGDFEALFTAYEKQLRHFVDIKIRGNRIIERIYATRMPAPFLSVLTDDCVAKGRDYNAGGARYNNTFIQAVGIGTISDCLAAIKRQVFDERAISLADLVGILDADFDGHEPLRQRLVNKMPKYGNDDDEADSLMVRVFDAAFGAIDGRPDTRGGRYRLEMLPTTCHVYFGSVTGATPDGRRAGVPLSEGISPVQGADRHGPTAVVKSAARMDHVKTGGTLLNMKFTPSLLEGEEALDRLASLVRSYFKLDGHHVQFNVVRAEMLREAQGDPEAYRDLIVRVAGYSDYFCDLSRELQDEIITRTEHERF
jgi:formate C-acetyltransferase